MPDYILDIAEDGFVVVGGDEKPGETLEATWAGEGNLEEQEVQISDGTGELIPFTTVDHLIKLSGEAYASNAELRQFISDYFRMRPVADFSLTTEGNNGPAVLEGKTLNIPEYEPENRIVTIPGAAYDLTLEDKEHTLVFTSDVAVTLNVPEGLGIDFLCRVIQLGLGDVTFSPSGAAAVHNRQSFVKTAGQYAVANLVSTDEDIFVSYGDMSV